VLDLCFSFWTSLAFSVDMGFNGLRVDQGFLEVAQQYQISCISILFSVLL